MDRPQQPPLLQLALLAAVITACSLAGWASAGRSLDHLQAPAGGAGLLAAVAIALLSLAWYRQNRQLRWRKAELRAQNLRLDAAVNNITQALLMFDAQARLILCNDRYREMYGYPSRMRVRARRFAPCLNTARGSETSTAIPCSIARRSSPTSLPARPPARPWSSPTGA